MSYYTHIEYIFHCDSPDDDIGCPYDAEIILNYGHYEPHLEGFVRDMNDAREVIMLRGWRITVDDRVICPDCKEKTAGVV